MISEIGASYSPGAYVGIPLLILAALTLVGSILWAMFGDSDWSPIAWFIAIVAALALGFGLVAYYPFSSDFHKYYPVTGTVQTVDSRLIGNGDSGVSQRFVVVLKESGQPFAVDDTRATLLKPGDPVSLRCKREFEFNSVPGWGCKWNANY